MTIWLIIHSLARLVIMGVCAAAVVLFFDYMNKAQRIGLGVAGGSALLTIPAIWQIEANPFEAWAASIFSIGILLFFGGSFRRMWRHKKANDAMKAQATAHFEGKGK